MIQGREIVRLFAGVMADVSTLAIVLGVACAVVACVRLSLDRSAFAPFAGWGVALLAASTGLSIGTGIPLATVAVAGLVALAVGLRVQQRLAGPAARPAAH